MTGVRLGGLGGCRSSASDDHVQVAWPWLLHFFLSSILTLFRCHSGSGLSQTFTPETGKGQKGPERDRLCECV